MIENGIENNFLKRRTSLVKLTGYTYTGVNMLHCIFSLEITESDTKGVSLRNTMLYWEFYLKHFAPEYEVVDFKSFCSGSF